MIKILLILLVLVHGLLHLLGFYRSISKAGVIRLPGYIPKPLGLLWLICAILFLLSGILIMLNGKGWIYFTMAALIISQVLILLSWKEARYGTVINILILVVSILYLKILLG